MAPFHSLSGSSQPRHLPLVPRHRTVLNLLGDGWNRKKIVGHLGISLNTVHGYVKDIFKHFGVHSQPELLGGDLYARKGRHNNPAGMTATDAKRLVACYALRWRIEMLFRILKSGCRAEQR